MRETGLLPKMRRAVLWKLPALVHTWTPGLFQIFYGSRRVRSTQSVPAGQDIGRIGSRAGIGAQVLDIVRKQI